VLVVGLWACAIGCASEGGTGSTEQPAFGPPAGPVWPAASGAGGAGAGGSGVDAGQPAPVPDAGSVALVDAAADTGAGEVDASIDVPPDPSLCAVADISDALRGDYDLDPFYTRFADANGIPVIASDSPIDEALRRACLLVIDLSSVRDDVRQALLDQKIRFIMMGADEKTVDTPDFAHLGDIDQRARGLGGVPAALCAEESILCDTGTDRWRGESICVHEYAHTMQMAGYGVADGTFNARMNDAYDAAMGAGLYADTYAASQPAEYFAEGVQDWYDTNLQATPPNGIHNSVNTRAELQAYDPELYDLLAEVLPDQPTYTDCYHYE